MEEVHDMAEVCEVVQKSTHQSGVNITIPTSVKNGDMYVDVHNWSEYFARKNWKRIPHISQYHHFTIDNKFPGAVRCHETLQDPGVTIQLCPVKPTPDFFYRVGRNALRLMELRMNGQNI